MHRATHRWLPIATVLLTLVAKTSAAEQVELHLNSGQVVTGELVSEDANRLQLKITMATKSGKPLSITKDYQRTEIAQIVRMQDPEDEFASRSAAAKTAEEHATLAAWCREHAMTDRAVDEAKRALKVDSKREDARKLLEDLGWVEVDGTWQKEAEWLARQGKVRYQGKVMTTQEADALKQQAKLKEAQAEAQQLVDAKTSALADLDKRITDFPKRPAEIDDEIAKAKADLAAAAATSQRAADAKAALDAADKRLTDAQNAPRPQGANGAPAAAPNLAPFQQALEDAQKAYNAAKRDAASADQDQVRIKQRLATLADERKNLDKKLAEMKAQREALAKELEDAKAALEEAKKAAAGSSPKSATSP